MALSPKPIVNLLGAAKVSGLLKGTDDGAALACGSQVGSSAESATPLTAAAAPITMPVSMVVRNPLVNCWAVATGMTISALTSKRPTVRMATVTVIAAITAISAPYNLTGMPVVRA